MTNNGTPNNRLDRLEAMLTSHAEMLNQLAPLMAQVAQIATTTSETAAQHDKILTRIEQQQELNTQAISELTENTNRVLARSAVLDDVLLELRDSFEQHQRNFEENQQTTNAALNQLGAILIQLTRIDPRN
ncbi:hypothetical protein H6G97_45135 [Nostoc flagelliforme FACHB-838]|uniref:Uncharacterized protein n=1 Tax=Nostoc flagelliforme FACHB-838 TaxID=2692904 RepID=A0ABR8E326_9NOSO|nr:hypothetical protein [Nostoc flagelliforme]MBD2536122.1 hypothetical protein [Nostoc flagelliforme FACHB-838]